jgi:FkbM family methyltransferase
MRIKNVKGWWFPEPEQHLTDMVQQSGEYQEAHRLFSLRWVRQFRTALDIGSHVGLWTRDLAAMFARVIAIEPIAIHRECFRRNVVAANVQLLPVAVGSKHGFATLDFNPANTGNTHICDDRQGDVQVITLDSLNLADVDYIKIDTEGYELHVLEGARETLLRCRPVVNIEQKSNSEQFYKIPRYSASEFLESLGARPLGRVVDDVVFGW